MGCALVYGRGCLFHPRTPTADDWAAAALGNGTASEREFAAVKLAQCGKPARKQLLRVLEQSKQPEVCVACIHGLVAMWDYRSMPQLIERMNDSSASIRLQAGIAVDCLLKRDYRLCDINGNHQETERKALIARAQADWNNFKHSSLGRAYIREKVGEDLVAAEERP